MSSRSVEMKFLRWMLSQSSGVDGCGDDEVLLLEVLVAFDLEIGRTGERRNGRREFPFDVGEDWVGLGEKDEVDGGLDTNKSSSA